MLIVFRLRTIHTDILLPIECISIYGVQLLIFLFFKQKTAYEMRISDWSSDVCSSDLTPLRLDGLSSRLTQVTGYRKTICKVKSPEYVVRRINGDEAPVMVRARAARTALVTVAREMIAGLHWADFETLVDLIFARSGWQRVSRVGGNLSDVDQIGRA